MRSKKHKGEEYCVRRINYPRQEQKIFVVRFVNHCYPISSEIYFLASSNRIFMIIESVRSNGFRSNRFSLKPRQRLFTMSICLTTNKHVSEWILKTTPTSKWIRKTSKGRTIPCKSKWRRKCTTKWIKDFPNPKWKLKTFCSFIICRKVSPAAHLFIDELDRF